MRWQIASLLVFILIVVPLCNHARSLNDAEIRNISLFFRSREINSIPGINERWHNWLAYYQGLSLPPLTESGFDVIQIPTDIFTGLDQLSREVVLHHEHSKGFDNSTMITGKVEVPLHVYRTAPTCFQLSSSTKSQLASSFISIAERFAGQDLDRDDVDVIGPIIYRKSASIPLQLEQIERGTIALIIPLNACSDKWSNHVEDQHGLIQSITLSLREILIVEGARLLHGRLRSLHDCEPFIELRMNFRPKHWVRSLKEIEDMIPTSWLTNTLEDRGSRWLDPEKRLAITVDSLSAEMSPPRIVRGRYNHGTVSPFTRMINSNEDNDYSRKLAHSFGNELDMLSISG